MTSPMCVMWAQYLPIHVSVPSHNQTKKARYYMWIPGLIWNILATSLKLYNHSVYRTVLMKRLRKQNSQIYQNNRQKFEWKKNSLFFSS